MSLTFFDRNGAPVVYTDDGEHIFMFSGQAVGYLHSGSIYSFSGKHLGTFENGWIRDHSGNAALFTQGAIGGPIKPIKHIPPIKGIKQTKPIKGVRQIAPIKPIKSLSWSALSGRHFFGA
jgi:hypothetical protein